MSNSETYLAVREGSECYHCEAYFAARPAVDTEGHRKAFEAGFRRGYDAGFDRGAHEAPQVDPTVIRNAQRYEWLRQHFLSLGVEAKPITGGAVEDLTVWPMDRTWRPRMCPPVLVDQAIDAAMEKWGAQPDRGIGKESGDV